MSIDPGSTGFGWIFWENGRPLKAGNFTPKVGNPHPNELKAWVQKADQVASELRFQIVRLAPTQVVCEWPHYREDVKGIAAAGSGSLVKLSCAVGQIMEICRENQVPLAFIQVVHWMGQLSDANVSRRVRERLGDTVCGELGIHGHAWDAAGIGIYYLTGVKL